MEPFEKLYVALLSLFLSTLKVQYFFWESFDIKDRDNHTSINIRFSLSYYFIDWTKWVNTTACNPEKGLCGKGKITYQRNCSTLDKRYQNNSTFCNPSGTQHETKQVDCNISCYGKSYTWSMELYCLYKYIYIYIYILYIIYSK